MNNCNYNDQVRTDQHNELREAEELLGLLHDKEGNHALYADIHSPGDLDQKILASAPLVEGFLFAGNVTYLYFGKLFA